ncbi:HipA N-terminal domain-containing protein [Psychromonas arctica]|uniref:HipA N-terminal domain-containing protein n=1 Tax=Psychromonas arctica TaxID=168275 RepID=UPI00248114CD|nr:HipA N-terminal domain-containing protein [Psychromonas arctica]
MSLSLKLQLPAIHSDAVINYFDNLLPDNGQVRDRIVTRYKVVSKLPFDLLKQVGKDSVGAIMMLPPEQPYEKEPLNYEILKEQKLEADEYLCIELARELGFKVPNLEIIKTKYIKALAVERFDRLWNRDRTKLLRLPQEDI